MPLGGEWDEQQSSNVWKWISRREREKHTRRKGKINFWDAAINVIIEMEVTR